MWNSGLRYKKLLCGHRGQAEILHVWRFGTGKADGRFEKRKMEKEGAYVYLPIMFLAPYCLSPVRDDEL